MLLSSTSHPSHRLMDLDAAMKAAAAAAAQHQSHSTPLRSSLLSDADADTPLRYLESPMPTNAHRRHAPSPPRSILKRRRNADTGSARVDADVALDSPPASGGSIKNVRFWLPRGEETAKKQRTGVAPIALLGSSTSLTEPLSSAPLAHSPIPPALSHALNEAASSSSSNALLLPSNQSPTQFELQTLEELPVLSKEYFGSPLVQSDLERRKTNFNTTSNPTGVVGLLGKHVMEQKSDPIAQLRAARNFKGLSRFGSTTMPVASVAPISTSRPATTNVWNRNNYRRTVAGGFRLAAAPYTASIQSPAVIPTKRESELLERLQAVNREREFQEKQEQIELAEAEAENHDMLAKQIIVTSSSTHMPDVADDNDSEIEMEIEADDDDEEEEEEGEDDESGVEEPSKVPTEQPSSPKLGNRSVHSTHSSPPPKKPHQHEAEEEDSPARGEAALMSPVARVSITLTQPAGTEEEPSERSLHTPEKDLTNIMPLSQSPLLHAPRKKRDPSTSPSAKRVIPFHTIPHSPSTSETSHSPSRAAMDRKNTSPSPSKSTSFRGRQIEAALLFNSPIPSKAAAAIDATPSSSTSSSQSAVDVNNDSKPLLATDPPLLPTRARSSMHHKSSVRRSLLSHMVDEESHHPAAMEADSSAAFGDAGAASVDSSHGEPHTPQDNSPFTLSPMNSPFSPNNPPLASSSSSSLLNSKKISASSASPTPSLLQSARKTAGESKYSGSLHAKQDPVERLLDTIRQDVIQGVWNVPPITVATATVQTRAMPATPAAHVAPASAALITPAPATKATNIVAPPAPKSMAKVAQTQPKEKRRMKPRRSELSGLVDSLSVHEAVDPASDTRQSSVAAVAAILNSSSASTASSSPASPSSYFLVATIKPSVAAKLPNPTPVVAEQAAVSKPPPQHTPSSAVPASTSAAAPSPFISSQDLTLPKDMDLIKELASNKINTGSKTGAISMLSKAMPNLSVNGLRELAGLVDCLSVHEHATDRRGTRKPAEKNNVIALDTAAESKSKASASRKAARAFVLPVDHVPRIDANRLASVKMPIPIEKISSTALAVFNPAPGTPSPQKNKPDDSASTSAASAPSSSSDVAPTSSASSSSVPVAPTMMDSAPIAAGQASATETKPSDEMDPDLRPSEELVNKLSRTKVKLSETIPASIHARLATMSKLTNRPLTSRAQRQLASLTDSLSVHELGFDRRRRSAAEAAAAAKEDSFATLNPAPKTQSRKRTHTQQATVQPSVTTSSSLHSASDDDEGEEAPDVEKREKKRTRISDASAPSPFLSSSTASPTKSSTADLISVGAQTPPRPSSSSSPPVVVSPGRSVSSGSPPRPGQVKAPDGTWHAMNNVQVEEERLNSYRVKTVVQKNIVDGRALYLVEFEHWPSLCHCCNRTLDPDWKKWLGKDFFIGQTDPDIMLREYRASVEQRQLQRKHDSTSVNKP